jgi:type IV pilus assembly protein PilW
MNRSIKQAGFTLVELMVAIVLGLIITAAAVQLFITGQVSLSTQKAMADLQESGNFGLRYITNDLRRTNYENVGVINDRLANGGVVLTSRNNPSFVASGTYTAANIPTNIPNTISVSVPISSSELGLSNVQVGALRSNLGSDVIVIQHYADQAGTDCEGNSYESGRYIVQRYFLRVDTNTSGVETNSALALACEAGSYTDASTRILKNPATSTTNFGSTQGEILIRRVDYLRFLLGVSNDANTDGFRYISVGDYLNMNQYPRPRIMSIQIGMLIRSNEKANSEDLVPENKQYDVLDKSVLVKKDNKEKKYMRRVVTQTIALRNGMYTEDKAVM